MVGMVGLVGVFREASVLDRHSHQETQLSRRQSNRVEFEMLGRVLLHGRLLRREQLSVAVDQQLDQRVTSTTA